jgi:hypothetical protein
LGVVTRTAYAAGLRSLFLRLQSALAREFMSFARRCDVPPEWRSSSSGFRPKGPSGGERTMRRPTTEKKDTIGFPDFVGIRHTLISRIRERDAEQPS